MNQRRTGVALYKVGLQVLNVILILLMAYVLRIILFQLFDMIKYLTE